MRAPSTELSSGVLAIDSCDYECDLASSWAQTMVAPSGSRSADMHIVPGDALAVAYGSGSSVVVRVP